MEILARTCRSARTSRCRTGGYQLIRSVRAQHPAASASVPAAALTAFARSEDKLNALQAGFQLHLAKPIDAHALVTAVAQLGGRLPNRRQAGAEAADELLQP